MGLIYRQESDLILGEGQCRVLMHSYNSAGPVAIHLYRKASCGKGCSYKYRMGCNEMLDTGIQMYDASFKHGRGGEGRRREGRSQ